MGATRTMSTSSSSSTTSTSMSMSTSTIRTSYLFIMITFLSFFNIVLSESNIEEMLLDLKKNFKNTGKLDSSWIKGTDPCDENKKWAGVQCKNGEVRNLRLKDFNLSGEFTANAISDFRGLRTINIAQNQFSGRIPDFYLIEGLNNVYAYENKFNGEIPPTFFSSKKASRMKIIKLSSNDFSGKIPGSLTYSVPMLKELELDHNGFTGSVPLFKQPLLGKLNLAFNKLEGEIPAAMIDKFGAKSFAENPGLCSSKIGKDCDKMNASADGEAPESSLTKWILLGVICVILLGSLLITKKNKNNNNHFTSLAGENLDPEKAQVHKLRAMSRSRTSSINRKGGPLNSPVGSSSRKIPNTNKGSTDFIIVNDERGTFGMPDLMKAAAEVLGNGALGSAYKALMGNGLHVVVKRVKDMNKMQRDEFDMEMRHLGKLRHRNILPLLAYNYRKDEKLIINEYVPRGSLMYLLHGDSGSDHADLTWPIRLKIIKGVAQGMNFLHTEFSTYELPHGNLKSCNILLSTNYEPLLTDYSFHPMFSTTKAVQSLFAYRSPEAIQYEEVSPKTDVFCLGIVILEILSGKFPSQYSNKGGGTDIVQWARSVVLENREIELIDPEIASERYMDEMVRLLHVGLDCTTDDNATRIHMREATSRIGDIGV